MKRTRLGSIALSSAALFAAALAAPSGAATPSESYVPTYQEFHASTYRDVDGQYVVNGDEPVTDNQDLRDFYERLVAGDTLTAGLVVNTVGGADDKWSTTQVRNLTYCVSTGFGARYNDMVAAMASGAGLWEAASSQINFVHVPSQDTRCNTRNKSVLFSVEPVNTTQYIARAFFPSTPKRQRNVLVDDSIWTSGSWTPTNIVGHELGHTLGFRHEHTRPEAGTCFEDNNWRPLTAYDSASIMHYPQCNGSSNDLSMTDTDRAGAATLYGA